MSKMMVSEEMKTPRPRRRRCAACCAGKGFTGGHPGGIYRQRRGFPYFLNIWNLSDATFTFTEKAIVVLPMAMLIIAREIDLSVASTMALSSTVMGFCAAAGWTLRCWWSSAWA